MDQLVGTWTLIGDDWDLLGNKSGATGLGFALLLKFFELEARFPGAGSDFPHGAVEYVADQIKVDATAIDDYEWSSRTAKRHRTQIRTAFGFREFSRSDEEKIAEWLAREVCPVEQRDEQLREAILLRCRTQQIEPPGRIERILGSARAASEKDFCDPTVARRGAACAERLEGLATDGADIVSLAELKADPGQVGLETLFEGSRQARRDPGPGVACWAVRVYAGQTCGGLAVAGGPGLPLGPEGDAGTCTVTLLAALCWQRPAEITDALVDLLIALVLKINTRADRRVERELTEDLRRVRGKEGILFRIAEAAIEQHPDLGLAGGSTLWRRTSLLLR
ncbi:MULTISPECIES: DUF4158 domain-containing protein [unclassified Arthrobacter]|uniref:DUF4158 domain-containing protein n=1 Tax=unclassified Arthrobacter TaxID=235627 RepID=UPI003399E7ED